MSESTLAERATGAQISDAVFEAHLASLKDAPEWLIELKKDAWARYKTLPEPSRKDESWRFATVNNLNLDDFPFGQSLKADGAPERPDLPCAGCLDFVNEEAKGGQALDAELAKQGVLFLPLEEAIRTHPELVRKHLFERLPDMGSEKYQALHAALFTTGVFLYVPRGVQVEQPLAVLHEAVGESAVVFPHTLVVADEVSSVTLFEIYRSQGDAGKDFACAVADVYAGPGANVRYCMVQGWSRETLAFHLNSVTAEKDSCVDAITVNVGGSHVRGEQHGRILGRGGDVLMKSLTLASGEQEIDQRTLQTHEAEGGHSDLLYKNVLLDRAHTVFSGMIRVSEEAQKTDAYQTNRNLLLSPDAESDSLPGLEILANDVKCSHGSSTGQLDADQLYYLLARGIPRQQAEALLVFGFFEQVLETFGNETMADYVRQLLQQRFSRQ